MTGTRRSPRTRTLLGQRAAAVATQLGVGIEIDYEQNTSPNMAGLQKFITPTGRSIHTTPPAADPTARLTIDLAAGDRWLIDDRPEGDRGLAAHRQPGARLRQRDGPGPPAGASSGDSATGRSTSTASRSTTRPSRRWRRRSSPAASTSPRAARSGRSAPTTPHRCRRRRRAYVHDRRPNGAGTHRGHARLHVLGRGAAVDARRDHAPPNTCEGGMGAGATALSIPIPMPALRQQ